MCPSITSIMPDTGDVAVLISLLPHVNNFWVVQQGVADVVLVLAQPFLGFFIIAMFQAGCAEIQDIAQESFVHCPHRPSSEDEGLDRRACLLDGKRRGLGVMVDVGQRVGIPGVEEPCVTKEAKVSLCFSVEFAQRLQDVLVRDWDVSDLCDKRACL